MIFFYSIITNYIFSFIRDFIRQKMNTHYREIEYKKLGDICDFMPRSNKSSSYGTDKTIDNFFPFYTSNKILYCNSPDYLELCLIFSTRERADVKISSAFSCSSDTIVIKINDSTESKYIYYWCKYNISKIDDLFTNTILSQDDLENLEIPIMSIDMQKKFIQLIEYSEDQIKSNDYSIESYKIIKKNLIDFGVIHCKTKLLNDFISLHNINELYNCIAIVKYNITSKCVFWSTDNLVTEEGQVEKQNCWSISVDDPTINEKYLYYYLELNQNKIYELSTGNNIKSISKQNFLNLEIPIPNRETQLTIINTCEYWDAQIKNLEKQNRHLDNIILSVCTMPN